MNKYRFKKGDRVVVAYPPPHTREFEWRGFVSRVSHADPDRLYVRVDHLNVDYGYHDEHLELEEIYYSPLYKALE
jgi:hypothetical protein